MPTRASGLGWGQTYGRITPTQRGQVEGRGRSPSLLETVQPPSAWVLQERTGRDGTGRGTGTCNTCSRHPTDWGSRERSWVSKRALGDLWD